MNNVKNKYLYILICVLSISLNVSSQQMELYSNDSFMVIHAKTINKKTGAAIVGARAYLTIPGTSFNIYSDLSDGSGELHFLIKKPDLNSTFIFSAEDADISIEKSHPFSANYSLMHIEGGSMQDHDSLPFYGTPDKRYLLDDYTRFSSLEEVLIEYVPEIKLRKQKDGFQFEVMNIPFKTFFETPPLVLLDGLPVFDINKLMLVNPLHIKKLEVVSRKYYYGSLVCYGVVSFTTYDGKMAGYQLPPNALVTEYAQQ